MKKLVRCKVCGYIMEEGKLGDRCPACGVPRTAFAPYVDPISAPRRQLLKFDLHPVSVHFVVSFTAAALVFLIALIFLSGEPQTLLINTTKILALLLPILVIIAGILGAVDGIARFRHIGKSQILQRKIIYASIMLVFSIALAIVVWISGLATTVFTVISLLLATIALVVVILLSLLGVSILEAAFPGK